MAPHHPASPGVARGARTHSSIEGCNPIVTNISHNSRIHALDLIEEHEARNLAWGLLDESWTHEEIVDLLDEQWEGDDSEACVEQLLADNLLVQLPGEWPNRYRTRMSEAVRLFSRLRQLFPNRPWQSGSHLVSDVRFLRRPRSFSVRNIDVEKCVDRLAELEVPAPV